MFELKAHIPLDKDLVIKVMDYDLIGGDDSIKLTFNFLQHMQNI